MTGESRTQMFARAPAEEARGRRAAWVAAASLVGLLLGGATLCTGLLAVLLFAVNPISAVIGAPAAVLLFLPHVAFLLWVRRNAPHPAWLPWLCLVWGGTVAVVVGLALTGLSVTLYSLVLDDWSTRIGPLFISTTALFEKSVAAPVAEELSKIAGIVVVAVLLRRRFHGVLDGAVLGAFVGLGFAMFENYLYYTTKSPFLILTRGIISSAGTHLMFSALAGAGVGLWRARAGGLMRWLAPPAALAAAIVLHGIWNATTVVFSPPPTELATLVEAAQRVDDGTFLIEASVRADQAATFDATGPDAPRHAVWVAPLADPDAGADREVDLWVTAPGRAVRGGTRAEWLGGVGDDLGDKAITVDVIAVTGDGGPWSQAVAAAEAEHGLHSAAGAPIVRYPRDPFAGGGSGNALLSLGTMVAIQLVYVLIGLVLAGLGLIEQSVIVGRYLEGEDPDVVRPGEARRSTPVRSMLSDLGALLTLRWGRWWRQRRRTRKLVALAFERWHMDQQAERSPARRREHATAVLELREELAEDAGGRQSSGIG